MSTGHTPGPWRVEKKHGLWAVHANDGNREYLFQHEANARLIAAAPELLVALVALVECPDYRGRKTHEMTAARAAIAKALGWI